MKWPMTFKFLASHDAVVACFDGVTFETPEDAASFMREVTGEVSRRFKLPVDYIIDDTGFIVKPKAARAFGIERLEFLRVCVRRSYRYNVDARTRVPVFTSGVIDGAQVNVFDTFEEVLARLQADRAAEKAAEAQATPAEPQGTTSPPSAGGQAVTTWTDPTRRGVYVKLPTRDAVRLSEAEALDLATQLTRLVGKGK